MRSLLLLLTLAFVACSAPQTTTQSEPILPPGDPMAYGLDQEEIDSIASHVAWAIDSSFISGAVVLIARGDQVIYHEAFGYSDTAKTRPMTTDNIFRLASMTKPITSTAIMQLVEQGKISTNDPVSKYIPEFADLKVLDTFNQEDSTFTTVPLEREVTIHHLLTHTSGIPYAAFHPVAAVLYPQFDFVEGPTKEPRILATNIPKQAQAPLLHQPGDAWTYGTNIDVLGYIVELVSGQPLDEYFAEHIFEPLNIEDMAFYLPDDQADRLVDVWFTPNIQVSDLPETFAPDYPVSGAKTYFAGGAGLVGTSTDYLKFASALLNGGALGEAKILDSTTVERMFSNQIDTLRLDEGVGFGYGGAVRTVESPTGVNAGLWGWDGFWQTYFRIDPENDMVMIMLTNAFNNPRWDDVLGGYEKLVVQSVED